MAERKIDPAYLEEIADGGTLDATSLQALFAYLEKCEKLAIDLIDHVLFDKPLPSGKLEGSIEWGFVLFWIHNPPPKIKAFLAEHPILAAIWKAVADVSPPTHIIPKQYDQLVAKIDDKGVPWMDGTLIGTGTYEQLDPFWSFSALNYAINKLHPEWVVHPFPTLPADYRPLPLASQSGGKSITIAIIGDWGTGIWNDFDGSGPARQIMAEVSKHHPDYIIHLGDVYYAGTEDRLPPFEEQLNFMDLWPERKSGTSFTLNSNHEMYGGAQGLFNIALKDGGPFTAQQGASYFALMNDDWAIIGLDSAYFADSSLYMLGSIGGTRDSTQADFLRGLKIGDRRTIVLTHHNPIDFLGEAFEPETSDGPVDGGLYAQVMTALGKAPDFWYWGHVHDGVVYNGNTPLGSATKGRCIGHSAIPFGQAWGMADRNTWDYYAHTPNSADPKGVRVLNGYAIITLTGAAAAEAVFEQGNPVAVWPAP